MALNRTQLAALLAKRERDNLGFSTSRLQELTDAEVTALEALFNAGPPRIKFRAGGFYGGQGTIDTLLLTEDQLVVGPIVVDEFCKIEEIGIDVTTAASEGNLYTALYADRGDGYPGALVHTSAALGITTGFKSTASLDIDLIPGLYWGGVVCNQVTTTVATVRSLINNSPYVGETAGANDINTAAYASPSTVTGAPPATFSSTVAVVAEAPRLLLKVKAF